MRPYTPSSGVCLPPPGAAGMAAQGTKDSCASLGPLDGLTSACSQQLSYFPLVSPQKSYKVGEVITDSPRCQHQCKTQLGTSAISLDSSTAWLNARPTASREPKGPPSLTPIELWFGSESPPKAHVLSLSHQLLCSWGTAEPSGEVE